MRRPTSRVLMMAALLAALAAVPAGVLAGAGWAQATVLPGHFGKLSPPDGAAVQPTLLSWEPSAGAASYEYCLDLTDNNACDLPAWTNVGNRTSIGLGWVAVISPSRTYYWQVRARNTAGVTEADGGSWWSFTTPGPPPNDRCANAKVVRRTPYMDVEWTAEATTDPEDPVPPAGNGSRARSVWYRFTAPRNGIITVDTFRSSYDTILSTYTGACGAFIPVPNGSNDNAGPSRQSRVVIKVAAGTEYAFMVTAAAGDGGRLVFRLRWGWPLWRARLTVFRPSTGMWAWVDPYATIAAFWTRMWGTAGDVPLAADLDGDGAPDLTVFRPSNGTWYVLESSTNASSWWMRQWGTPGDVPAPADYDGDGVDDLAVYRPSTGTWYVRSSSAAFAVHGAWRWGGADDIPVPADYDGDGLADLAVFRPSNGTWYIRLSSTGFQTVLAVRWGAPGDWPVPGDFDGDGGVDLAVFRPKTGTWFVLPSSAGHDPASAWSVRWGADGDIPVAADYDGDDRLDLAVWRPSEGVWYVREGSGACWGRAWGTFGDVPVATRPGLSAPTPGS